MGFPTNTSPPVLSGGALEWTTWTVDVGTWVGSPTPTIAIYWLRCNQPVSVTYSLVPAGCAVIDGEHGTAYVSKAADVGKYLTAQVAGNNSVGFTIVGTTNVVETTASAPMLPANTTPPIVSGASPVGSTWTVDVGTWSGAPTPTIAVNWLRCNQPVSVTYSLVPAGCTVIGGATARSYVSTTADIGKYLTAQVAGNSLLGFTIVGTISTTRTMVTLPVNTSPPIVSGASPVGSTWTVDVGTWSGAPTPTIAVNWLRCNQPVSVTYSLVPAGCTVIGGATARSYVSTTADVGKYLTAQVAGNSPQGFTIMGTTNVIITQAPASALPANTVPPVLSGGAPVGSTWTVDVGTWVGSPTPTIAIYWLRCNQPVSVTYSLVPAGCAVIDGEHGTAYVSKAADVGKYLTAQVAGNSSLGFSIVGTTNTLAVGFPTNTSPPVLSGGVPVGSTWTVDVGTWVGSPTPTIAIYWLRCNQPVSVTYSLVPAGCAVIDGEHGTAYVSKAADVGKYLTAQVAGNSSLGFSIVGTTNTTPTQ